MDNDKHEFVLDFATWFHEPDDPAFVKLCHLVFDRTIEGNKFHTLFSTRHFGSLVFYMVLNDNIPPLLNYYGSTGRYLSSLALIFDSFIFLVYVMQQMLFDYKKLFFQIGGLQLVFEIQMQKFVLIL